MKKEFRQHKDAKIYIAGHRGLIGTALLRALKARGYTSFLLRTSKELDLRDPVAVEAFFEKEKPDFVFIAAAKVGGIKANMDFPVDFIYDNLQIQNNIIHAAWKHEVSKLLFLGSSCIYPREAPQPIKEEYFMTGPFEPTNQPYAVAKTAGIELCKAYRRQYGCNFISVMPNNLYGPGDNFDPNNSHLMAALIRKFHEAKASNHESVTLWGTGTPRREMLYSDDAAEACVLLMEQYDSSEIINIGLGEDNTVREIAALVKEVVGFEGTIVFDSTKPDGMMRRLVDVTKIQALGWKASMPLQEGIRKSYEWFLENVVREQRANL